MDMTGRIAALIGRTSSALPPDALKAIRRAARREAKGSSARMVFDTILANATLAARNGTPMCQDTGTLTFFVDERLRGSVTPEVIGTAVEAATERGWLRRNTIDAATGRSIDSNTCEGAPVIHYVRAARGRALPYVTLLMKGGGSENMSRQYSLPDAELGAGRDFEGVRRCVIDAALKAQGYGCAPGIIGVCIGGDRAGGYEEAKLQLLRRIDDSNPDPGLARFERMLAEEVNSLGIGPMGLGGRTTVLGIKVGCRPRVPASYFVTVAYLCWAARRRTIRFRAGGGR